METNGISQSGLETGFMTQKMNESMQQTKSQQEQGSSQTSGADTVNINAKTTEKPILEFDPLDEKKADILAELIAAELTNRPFGIATQAGTDVLRTFM